MSPVGRWLERLALGVACLTLIWGPLAQGSTASWGLSGLTVLGTATALLTVLALSAAPGARRGVLNAKWCAAALAFLGWIWLSTLWAPDRGQASEWAGVWTAVLGTGLSVHLLATSVRRERTVLTVLVLTGAVALGLAFLQTRGIYVPGFDYYPGTGTQVVTGPYFNPSHFSGYLIPLAALSTSLVLFTRPHLHTLLLLGGLGALHWINLRTDSSSIPAVLLATALPFVVWVWRKHFWTGAALTILALVTAAAGLVFFLGPRGQEVFATYQTRLGISRDFGAFRQERQATWRYGAALWREQPVRGAGIGQFVRESSRVRAPERAVGAGMDRGFVNYAHNDALQVLSELGLPGLVLFGLTLALALTRHPSLSTLTWWALLPTVLFVGIYDAHATAIPGTSLILFTLAGLSRSRPSAPAAATTVPVPSPAPS